MARPGTKAAKKRDPRRADEWPVATFPYRLEIPYADPKYCRSLKEAKNEAIKRVERTRAQFLNLDSDVVARCDHVIGEIKKIGDEGGQVRHMIDTHTSMYATIQIFRRQTV